MLGLLLTALIITCIIHTNNGQEANCSDINGTFPINMDNTVCHGLYNIANIKTYDECAQVCCLKPGCEVYQFCGAGMSCGNAPECWIGGNDYCSYSIGWRSRARVEPPTSHIWPLPYQYTFSPFADVYVDSDNFKFTLSSTNSDIMNQAIIRYTSLTFPQTAEATSNSGSSITSLTITINDYSEDTLQYGMDESYNLSITNDSKAANLRAQSIWGALRGLETFSQLVIFNSTLLYYTSWSTVISDQPRFGHRGIMIDTSRHFLTVKAIQNLIDSLSYAKFNVLHWHITDSPSFPMQSKLFPRLWNGAFSNYERFLQNDVSTIVQYAKYRGIRVVPEFDIPGHAESWCVGYPDICPSTSCKTPLNVASNMTWQVLDAFIGNEVVNLFEDNYIHLGGDEVNTKCWESTPSIVSWMNSMNFTANDALRYFDERAQSIVVNANKQVMVWVSVFNSFNATLNPKYVTVQVYKNAYALKHVVEAGFQGILSNAFGSTPWYLDYLQYNWQAMYMNEPLAGIDNITQQQLVIGGEGCMWGETVDVSDLENTIWPRAASIAERLWSRREVNSTSSALPRISYFRCLLNERGIKAALINNKDARQPPPQPGSCYALYERRRRRMMNNV